MTKPFYLNMVPIVVVMQILIAMVVDRFYLSLPHLYPYAWIVIFVMIIGTVPNKLKQFVFWSTFYFLIVYFSYEPVFQALTN